MNKKSINLTYVFLILAIVSILFISFSAIGLSSSTSLAISSLGGDFSVSARNGIEFVESDSESTYSGSPVHIYKWRNVDKISMTYQYDPENPPPPNNLNQQLYTFKISLEYLQGYLNSSFNPIVFDNAFGPYNNRDISSLGQTFNFDINLGMSRTPAGEVNTVTVKGWGIYRFKITINGLEKYSDFVFIEPDYQIENAPIIDYLIVESQNSMHNSYSFFISNAEEYTYIDQKAITWYVKGESEDGTRYALTSSDLMKDKFADCSAPIYEDVERNGTSFLFNDNEINGKWTVWCEYKNPATNEVTISQNETEVESTSPYSITSIFWIVGGVSILAVSVVLVVALVRAKKDKVW